MTRYNLLNRLLHRLGYELTSAGDDVPTGADAVVTDYNERKHLSERTRQITATWDSVERVADDGYFNSVTVANITFDIGEYGEKTMTFGLEDELPQFLSELGLLVDDLPQLVDDDYAIPMFRAGGDWMIDFSELDEWDAYNVDA